jgi:CheY-like chemotaxis protein
MRSAVLSALRARKRQYAARADLHEQQRAVRLRDQFLAMLGHELRNPLAAIAMAVKLDDANEGSLYRAIVERQTEHLTRLVDDLLDVSRVTSGKIVLRRVRVDVVELLRRCTSALGKGLEQQGLVLELTLPSQPVLVDGDAVRLEQMVTNLITNAAKYTQPGGHVWVSVSTAEGQARIVVRDDGVGIGAEMLPRVFDLFTQVESTLDRAQGGMGIGLTLVRSLVELHHGRVEAASAGLGQGSTFTVYLPTCLAHQTQQLPAHKPRSDAPKPAQHVLIVEDNADSRELLRMGLSRRGHRVSASADGIAGVEAALKERPQAMLVDIGLPGLDGYGVARRVRSALGRSIYLVALTGYGQPEDRVRALDAGFDVHLTKPVDVSELEDLLVQREG